MMKYNILSADDDYKLCVDVQTHLNDGWQLHGGPYAVVLDDKYWVQQALIFPLIPSNTSDDLEAVEHVINLCDKYEKQLADSYAKDFHRAIQSSLMDLQAVVRAMIAKGL